MRFPSLGFGRCRINHKNNAYPISLFDRLHMHFLRSSDGTIDSRRFGIVSSTDLSEHPSSRKEPHVSLYSVSKKLSIRAPLILCRSALRDPSGNVPTTPGDLTIRTHTAPPTGPRTCEIRRKGPPASQVPRSTNLHAGERRRQGTLLSLTLREAKRAEESPAGLKEVRRISAKSTQSCFC